MTETGRGRRGGGGRDQERFWIRLLRYASEEPYAAIAGTLCVDVDKVVASIGEPIHVRARLVLRLSEWPPPTAIDMTLLQGGQTVKLGTLEPAGNAADGRYAAVLNDLPAGQYELRVAVPLGDRLGHELSLPLHIQQSTEQEMREVAGDRHFLQRLSEVSGGRCLNLEQVTMLPTLFEQALVRQPRVSELELWDSHYLLVFVLSCLGGEWAIRKRLGLA